MVKMTATYTGGLRCEVVHEPSGSLIRTDAPKDNMGKGELFSPTDMVGAALATCILTTLGIVAQRNGIRFESARAEVEKEMTPVPTRKIASLRVTVRLPPGLSPEHRRKLEAAGHHCPVHKSLHPDVAVSLQFIYE